MKAIIDFLKKHWFPLVLASILFGLVVMNLVSTCSAKHTENLINQTELQMAINHVKDSIKTADLQRENAKIDSTRRAEALKTQTANNTAQIHAKTANKYMALAERKQAELDSLKAINAPCDQQLSTCKEINGTLRTVIIQKDSAIKQLDTSTKSCAKQLTLCDEQRKNDGSILQSKITQIGEVTRINASLTKELKSKDNLFNKSKLWIGVVLGVVFTYLVVK